MGGLCSRGPIEPQQQQPIRSLELPPAPLQPSAAAPPHLQSPPASRTIIDQQHQHLPHPISRPPSLSSAPQTQPLPLQPPHEHAHHPHSHPSTPPSLYAYRPRAPSHSRVSSHSLPSPLLLPALPALTLPLPPSLSARSTPQSGQPHSGPRQLLSYDQPPPIVRQIAQQTDESTAAPSTAAAASASSPQAMNVSPLRPGGEIKEQSEKATGATKRAEAHEIKQPDTTSTQSSGRPMLRVEGDVKEEQNAAFSGKATQTRSHEPAARVPLHQGQPKQLYSTPEELQAAIKRGATEVSPEEEQEKGTAQLGSIRSEDKTSRAYPQLSPYASPSQAAREHAFGGAAPAKAGADEASQSGQTAAQSKEGPGAEFKDQSIRAEGQPREGEEGWTMVEKPTLMEKVSQQIAQLWNTTLLPTARKAGVSIMAASDKAMQQVKGSIEHPTTQSLWKDGAAMFGQVRTKYGGSMQCMMREVKAMSLEEQLPLVSLFVLHWLLPLTYISFDEAQLVLKYSLLSYIIMHSLFHFTKMSLHESIHVSHLAFVPMLFSLWMHTGAEGLMMAHPGWLQLLHARPADMHLFLLWLRANMMCTFAILCRDIRVLLSWQAPKAAAGAGVGAGVGAGPGAVPSSSGGGAGGQLAAVPSSSAAHVAPVDASQSGGGTVHVQVDLPKQMSQGGAGSTALQLSP